MKLSRRSPEQEMRKTAEEKFKKSNPITLPLLKCGPEKVAPPYGSYGSYFRTKKVSKKVPSAARSTDVPKYRTHLPSPIPYPSFTSSHHSSSLSLEDDKNKKKPHYNLMWDPHVIRGSGLIDFFQLEKQRESKCIAKRRARIASRMHELTTSITASSAIPTRRRLVNIASGKESYPQITFATKIPDCKDYSTFLEEDPLLDESKRLKAVKVQTDFSDEGVPIGEIHPKPRTGLTKNRTGISSGDQVDSNGITLETNYGESCTQNKISRMSQVISSKVTDQALLETMEVTELDIIRGQCEEINHWISKELRRKWLERKERCRRQAEIEYMDNMKRELEGEGKILEERVGSSFFTRRFIQQVFDGGYEKFRKEGLVVSRAKIEADDVTSMKKWLDKKVKVDIAYRKKILAREMVDQVLQEVSAGIMEEHKAFLSHQDISSSLEVEKETSRPSLENVLHSEEIAYDYETFGEDGDPFEVHDEGMVSETNGIPEVTGTGKNPVVG